MMQERNKTIDILKGIGIFLVVIGHSCGPLTNYIYLFHMQLFFMSAGYCYNTAYSKSIEGIIRLTKKRLVSLWKPYVIGNGVFILLNNLFLILGIYTTDSRFLYGTIGNSFGLGVKASLPTTINWLIHCVLFNKSTQLSSSSWFLEVLFFVTILFAITDFMLQRIVQVRMRNILNIAFAITLLLIGYIVGNNPFFMRYRLGVILSSYVFFLLGHLWKKWRFSPTKKMQLLIVAITAIALIFLEKNGSVQISANEYTDPIFFLICGVLGWVLVWTVSSLLGNNYDQCGFARFLEHMGKSTMIILFVHLLLFKPITLVQTMVYGLPDYRLASFHVLYSNGLWWVAYTICGLFLSLVVVKVWYRAKLILFQRNDSF